MSRLDENSSNTDEHVLINSFHFNLSNNTLDKNNFRNNKKESNELFESSKKVKLSP